MVDVGRDKKASHERSERLSLGDIVGQAELKRALLAVTANPALDGLLVQGEKGTAKSTAVRALADCLPAQSVVADCPYGCPPDGPGQCDDCRKRTDPPTAQRPVPLVTLPLGATRERVVGTLSVADALAGDHEFEPGLLARANRGILYVDEVNLLEDHLVDVLLDAAARGVNRVERDGVSVSHPASFTLVGTMNPEEGQLRPQLRDRFALQTTVTGCEDIEDRVRVIDRALGCSDPDDTAADGSPEQRLRTARDRLPEVALPDSFATEIAELCRDAGLDGHRGDIALARTARTFAALDGRSTVIEPDIREAASLALPHRLQSTPFEDAPDPDELLDDQFDDEDASDDGDTTESGPGDADPGEDTTDGTGSESESGQDGPETASEDRPGDEGQASSEAGGAGSGDHERGEPAEGDSENGEPLVPGQERAGVGSGAAPSLSAPEAVEDGRQQSGGRALTSPDVDSDGPRVRTRRADSTRRIDAAASVRAASSRGGDAVESRDLRQSIRQGDAGALVLFVVDASASMRPAMRAAKGTLLELLRDAYQQRDEVGFVTFAGDDADVLLPPTDSVTLAARHLKQLPTGDRTPLPAGLRTATEVLDRADPAASVVVLVTDGRANVAAESPVEETRTAARELAQRGPEVVVVDAAEGDSPGLTDLISEATDADRVPLTALTAERVDAAAGTARES